MVSHQNIAKGHSRLLALICGVFFCAFTLIGCDSNPVEVSKDLGTPALVAPTPGSQTDDAVLLDWTDVDGAYSYRVQVSTKADFTSAIYTDKVYEYSEAIIQNLEQNKTHYWRALPLSKTGAEGRWSEIFTFVPVRQAEFPINPSQIYPDNGTGNHDRSVRIRWASVEDAISYHLVVTIDEDMLLYQVDLENVKSTSYLVEGLVLTYPYWWEGAYAQCCRIFRMVSRLDLSG